MMGRGDCFVIYELQGGEVVVGDWVGGGGSWCIQISGIDFWFPFSWKAR